MNPVMTIVDSYLFSFLLACQCVIIPWIINFLEWIHTINVFSKILSLLMDIVFILIDDCLLLWNTSIFIELTRIVIRKNSRLISPPRQSLFRWSRQISQRFKPLGVHGDNFQNGKNGNKQDHAGQSPDCTADYDGNNNHDSVEI